MARFFRMVTLSAKSQGLSQNKFCPAVDKEKVLRKGAKNDIII